MLTADGPRVIEYNARFGDPETQVVLPRVANDVLALLWAASHGSLAGHRLVERPVHALCVVVAARGYPDAFPRGDPITLPEALPAGVAILHAGTARDAAGRLVTAGGRVLGVLGVAPDLRAAADAAYAACARIECASKYYRRDIGARQLHRG
jgi:phosphoribosylamine--glycine ligase